MASWGAVRVSDLSATAPTSLKDGRGNLITAPAGRIRWFKTELEASTFILDRMQKHPKRRYTIHHLVVYYDRPATPKTGIGYQ